MQFRGFCVLLQRSLRIAASGGRRGPLGHSLSPLSHALDLVEGTTVGHTIRSCLIGMRLAKEAGVGAAERSALHHAIARSPVQTILEMLVS